jgi:hypothetical protein
MDINRNTGEWQTAHKSPVYFPTCPDCEVMFRSLTHCRIRCVPCASERSKVQLRAQSAVRRALKRGDLFRLPCEVCGSANNVDAHHDDYSQPLSVRWLCRSHHQQHHVKHGSPPTFPGA